MSQVEKIGKKSHMYVIILNLIHTHTHTHSHTYIYIYIYICIQAYTHIYLHMQTYIQACRDLPTNKNRSDYSFALKKLHPGTAGNDEALFDPNLPLSLKKG